VNQNSTALAVARFFGGIGGAAIVAGGVFFTLLGTDANQTALIAGTGAAFCAQLAVAFNVRRGA
jgi:hypothetical protein